MSGPWRLCLCQLKCFAHHFRNGLGRANASSPFRKRPEYRIDIDVLMKLLVNAPQIGLSGDGH